MVLQPRYSQLLVRLKDALELHPEVAEWRAMWDRIAYGQGRSEESASPAQWYRMPNMRDRVLREKHSLEQLLQNLTLEMCLPSGNLVARGTVALSHSMKLALELAFPCDSPSSPPRIFLLGPGVREQVGDLLRDDESIPVPAGRHQHWGPDVTADIVVRWALQWLQDNTRIVRI